MGSLVTKNIMIPPPALCVFWAVKEGIFKIGSGRCTNVTFQACAPKVSSQVNGGLATMVRMHRHREQGPASRLAKIEEKCSELPEMLRNFIEKEEGITDTICRPSGSLWFLTVQ